MDSGPRYLVHTTNSRYSSLWQVTVTLLLFERLYSIASGCVAAVQDYNNLGLIIFVDPITSLPRVVPTYGRHVTFGNPKDYMMIYDYITADAIDPSKRIKIDCNKGNLLRCNLQPPTHRFLTFYLCQLETRPQVKSRPSQLLLHPTATIIRLMQVLVLHDYLCREDMTTFPSQNMLWVAPVMEDLPSLLSQN